MNAARTGSLAPVVDGVDDERRRVMQTIALQQHRPVRAKRDAQPAGMAGAELERALGIALASQGRRHVR